MAEERVEAMEKCGQVAAPVSQEPPASQRGDPGVVWLVGILVAGIFLLTMACYAQEPDAVAIVKNASFNELKASNGGHPYRYRLHKIDDGKVTTKIIVETKDGDIARLIEVDDKPLSPEANQAELDRLQNLYDHPEIQQHRHKKEQEDSGRENEMVRLLPDAFLYHYEGVVPGPNGPAYRLTFKPNQDSRRPIGRPRFTTAWRASCGWTRAKSGW